MRTRNILLAAMLAALYGCQPETPAQPPAEAVMEPPVAAMSDAPMAMMPAQSEPAMMEMPAPAMEQKPMPAKKAVEAPVEKPAAMMEKAAPAPAMEKVAPAMTAPIVELKPEAGAMPSEADVLALAKKSGCLVCHAIDKKIVGPSWKDVAAKYRGDAGAEARLMDKIAKGGSGVWGSIAMPPNPKLSEADRRALVKFLLSLK